MNSTNDNISPLNIHYSLEIEGIQLGVFDRISGGDTEIDVIRHQVVYENGGFSTLMLPGPRKNQPVVLEGGYGKTGELYSWFEQAARGDIFSARRNATISLNAFIDGEYQPIIQWHLIGVWPAKLSGITLGQSNTELARFSITLVFEAIEREDL